MIEPLRALRLGSAPRLALVGAGGKSALLFRLAAEYAAQGAAPILTTTTHLSTDQAAGADRHTVLRPGDELTDLETVGAPGSWLFTGPETTDSRLSAPPEAILVELGRLSAALGRPLLIEADGSRRKPLKAPAGHEPVIPPFVTEVAVLAGLSGLGEPLAAAAVHRPERFAALSGLTAGEPVTVDAVATVLAHPDGGLRGIPEHARRVVVLTQANSEAARSQAATLARGVLPAYDAVVVANLDPEAQRGASGVFAVHERIAGVILAAGGASRFAGGLKQLASWRGAPLVRHVAEMAVGAGLDPVVVVLGAEADAVRAAVTDLPIRSVVNPDWEQGQSLSLRAGLAEVPEACGGAVFLLADQPQIPATLVRALLEQHRQSLAPILAPQIEGRRGNPVLFDRSTFADLASLEGDVGGRALFSRHRVTWLDWHQPGLLLDVDTPEDLARLEREFPVG